MRLSRHDIPAARAASWPLPGSGRTHERWQALSDLAREDVVVARLSEAHADACAITAELGVPTPRAGQLWGVWAAEPPHPSLVASTRDGTTVLSGRKPWCSGAGLCTHALVTARVGEESALFAVDLGDPGVTVVPDTWHGFGMSRSATLSVDFADVPAVSVAPPGGYVGRPGFWHGAIGVAACWLGAARGVADRLLDSPDTDLLRDVHRGAVDAALYGAQCALHRAAAEIDADPEDLRAARIRARRVRAVIEDAATRTLEQVGRALGAGPLCRERRHADRVADLTVYLRQSHGERDLADLGALVGRR